MTFGKDTNPVIAGRKGYKKTKDILWTREMREKRSEKLKERWKDPNERKVMLLGLERGRKNMNQSEAGKKSRYYENKIAKTIVADKVYLPNEVCDRIVVRDGEIFFIEIKRKGQRQRLRPKQKEFSEVAKEKYEILYG